ncbi:hypothetical protein [Streptomyces hygroscopicus]|uniref:hypothetical protein n=1 Tax=Streptomyces hygroscopicus TaxID=1912 RepID=UPI001FCC60F8|nr:hypothetical protein [Streptomyces hygroscopicus]BDH13091.1 hypothetical protein HOK021_42700 [Streptomyces hygroscopicus]
MSMDPRELWDRNAVLAEAFCLGDERVREAQARLDEAQADRSRVLAAFAVTVGSTGAVAGLFGLNEREVRIARRTVGKDDARAVAEELLAAATPAAPAREPDEASPAPDPAAEYSHQNPTAGARPAGSPREGAGGTGAPEQNWSPAMDAVLIGSWQTGVDLRELAAEFGLDLTRLVTRAQQLSAQGRFYPGPAENHAGRHRRGPGDVHETEYTIPAQQTAAWNAAPSGYQMASAWHTGTMPSADSVPDMAALASEWDNALAPWGTLAPSHEDSAPAHQPWAQYHLSS